MARGDIVVGDGEARRRKRLLAILIVLVLIIGLVAGAVALLLSEDDAETASPQGEGSTETVVVPGADAGPTIEDDAAAVAAAIEGSAAPWRAQIISVRVITVLRRPVIELTTDIGGEQADDIEHFTTSVTSFCETLPPSDGLPRTYFLRVLSAEGDIVGAVAFPDARWTLAGPAAPTDGASLYAWLESVYGSGSPSGREPWLDRITSIAEPAADPEGHVGISTDLDPADPGDLQLAQSIFDAVNSSGATFAPGIRITFADPSFEWTGVMDGVDPYAP